ncbi:N-acetylmuramoyl-L-alanine amidase [Rhodococcoides kroppenstedtii]|uniref:N-acetylmuramoyl-L-alanine amidase n=2 Tax=Rhodococcoides kroppenstedtii TaxID=293050 RepID=A0A1I0UA88_9NOCA|nr:N-acetylmuramoyl-L-alanine amidase [Rhodococcus kroppenstedtii]SFA60783.1 N-acetylmuramoyl-L-alanine amidase [Rhodococcus kroppenstedtii]
MPKPAYDERIQWSPHHHARPVRDIRFGAIHTQEGPGTAASLANYLCNPSSQVSYHYTVDNDRNVVAVVDTDDASWSVGNANGRVVNVCFAGSFVRWSKQEWLDRMGNAIEIAAYLQVLDARKYGFDPVVRGWDELRSKRNGLTDHRGINMAVLGGPGHTDVGDNFPWDVYAGHVDRFVREGTDVVPAGPDPALPTVIEQCRAANDWLGAKVSDGREVTTPDGAGRFAQYEHGWVYWSPTVDEGRAAYAIPFGPIGDAFAATGYEAGRLGYPRGPKLDLLPFTRSTGRPVAGGVVQAFQHGTVYDRAEEPTTVNAYIVQGTIREKYASLDYERGELGWPLSDEMDWAEGKWQRFEHGVVYWTAATNSAIAFVGETGKVRPISPPRAPVAPAPAPPAPAGYVPSDDERQLTPRDNKWVGGISHFATPGDASTRGRNMGVSGEPADNPRDPFYCAMRWGYVGLAQHRTGTPGWVGPVDRTDITPAEKMRLKTVLASKRVKVTGGGRSVVLRPADWGPAPTKRVVDVSPTVLAGLGLDTDDEVTVEWVAPTTPLGFL